MKWSNPITTTRPDLQKFMLAWEWTFRRRIYRSTLQKSQCQLTSASVCSYGWQIALQYVTAIVWSGDWIRMSSVPSYSNNSNTEVKQFIAWSNRQRVEKGALQSGNSSSEWKIVRTAQSVFKRLKPLDVNLFLHDKKSDTWVWAIHSSEC